MLKDSFTMFTATRRASSPLNKRIRIGPRLGAKQLGQLRNIRRNPPRLVAPEAAHTMHRSNGGFPQLMHKEQTGLMHG
jgi:hypothetical protein